jgi:hypothetical protein
MKILQHLFFFMRLILFSFFCSHFSLTSIAQSTQQFTISGFVKEAVSSESLIGVNIYLPDLKIGTTTNNYGFYSITIPKSDLVNLRVSYVGYSTESLNITLLKDVELNITLKPNQMLQEVIISADLQEKESENPQMSTCLPELISILSIDSMILAKRIITGWRPITDLIWEYNFHKQKRWGERTWEISVYNAYNRKNPFFYYNDTESSGSMSYGKLNR